MRILIFCHVEPGTVQGRELVFHPRHVEGIAAALPRIVDFADEHALSITFAMTATATRESETDLAGHEVGVHLHPQDAQVQARLDRKIPSTSDCLRTYSEEDQAALINAAKESFEDEEGFSPRTFVAGHWSENTTTLKLLARSGFSFDGSPLPLHTSPCADWGRVPRLAQPYAPGPEDYQAGGSMDYLYLPASLGLWGHYLTPELLHLLGVSYFKAALKEASMGGAEVVQMFFHSPMAIDPFFLSEFSAVVDYAHDELRAESSVPSSCRPGRLSTSRPFPPVYFARLNWRLAKGVMGRGELGRRLMGKEPLETAVPSQVETDRESRD